MTSLAGPPEAQTSPRRPPRRSRAALWSAIAVGVVVVLFVAVLATRESAETRLAQSPLLGKVAPTLQGADLDGRPVDLVDARGRWVVLNFFSTWCVPCRQEHPELLRFQQRRADDATVLAVIWQDTEANVRDWFARRGGDWPVIDDPGSRVALEWGVRGPPETYVVAPNGIVVAKFLGPVTDRALNDVIAGRRA